MRASPACDDLLYRWRGFFTGSHEQHGSQAEQAALLNPSGVGGGVQGAKPIHIDLIQVLRRCPSFMHCDCMFY